MVTKQGGFVDRSISADLQRIGYQVIGQDVRPLGASCGCNKVERKAKMAASAILYESAPLQMAERFYRHTFKRIDALSAKEFDQIPTDQRLLDARVLAAKLEIDERHLTENPDLHYFLRGCKFHSQAQRFENVKLRIVDGEVALPFENGPQKWSKIKDSLRIRETGSSSARGQLLDYSLTDRGYVRHPDLSKFDRASYGNDYLRLSKEAFVAVETHDKPPWGERWVLVLSVDAKKDRYSNREHGYFEILTPDGRRIVTGKQRESAGFDLQPGYLAFVDPRFYRHFSGNPDPIWTQFELSIDDLPHVFNYLLDLNESASYQQATGNCVSDQRNVMELLGYNWESRAPAFNYILPIVPDGDSLPASALRTGFNLLANGITYYMGGMQTRPTLTHSGKPTSRANPDRLFSSLSDLLDPSRGMVDSAFKSGQLIQSLTAFRQSFVDRVSNEDKQTVIDAVRYLIPPDLAATPTRLKHATSQLAQVEALIADF